ncbi:TonB-dependent receptor, partial [Azotobacter chroococcum]|nr:TonB-dependent receptor [Azotobacter chroococcum]
RSLDEETSHNAELTLRKFAGRTTFSLTLYRNQVDDYIYAADTGRDIGSSYREIEYRQEDALFTGAEGEVRFQASDATAVTLFGDRVRGKLLDGGGDLPRIPAGRLGVRLDHGFTPSLDGQLEFYRVDHQQRLADFETETSGYSMLGTSLTYHGAFRHADYQVYLKGDNLLDQKIRDHSSFIKDDVVQPGRNLTLGMRMTF